jgi:hypothetical protein
MARVKANGNTVRNANNKSRQVRTDRLLFHLLLTIIVRQKEIVTITILNRRNINRKTLWGRIVDDWLLEFENLENVPLNIPTPCVVAKVSNVDAGVSRQVSRANVGISARPQ